MGERGVVQQELLVQNVRLLNGDTVDVLVAGNCISAVGTDLTASSLDITVLDGENRLLFPGFVDAHAHMDKTLIGLGWYRNEVGPTIQDKIDNERRLRVERGIDFYEQ